MTDELAALMRYYQKCAVGGCGSKATHYVTVLIGAPDAPVILDAVPMCRVDADEYGAKRVDANHLMVPA